MCSIIETAIDPSNHKLLQGGSTLENGVISVSCYIQLRIFTSFNLASLALGKDKVPPCNK